MDVTGISNYPNYLNNTNNVTVNNDKSTKNDANKNENGDDIQVSANNDGTNISSNNTNNINNTNLGDLSNGSDEDGSKKDNSNNKNLDKTIEKLNKLLEKDQTHAEYSYYKELNRTVIKIVDDKNKKVIMEFPSEKLLDSITSLLENAGLIDKKA